MYDIQRPEMRDGDKQRFVFLFDRSIHYAAQVFAEKADSFIQKSGVMSEGELKVINTVVADLIQCFKNSFPIKAKFGSRVVGGEMLI